MTELELRVQELKLKADLILCRLTEDTIYEIKEVNELRPLVEKIVDLYEKKRENPVYATTLLDIGNKKDSNPNTQVWHTVLPHEIPILKDAFPDFNFDGCTNISVKNDTVYAYVQCIGYGIGSWERLQTVLYNE